MQTALADFIRDTPSGQEADRILRSCVHCGFCNATCPTYQLLGDELDGPRGRIYLIKQMLEGAPVAAATRLHLDRCLTCRACETTCPSGVRYSELLDIGRSTVEHTVPRSPVARLQRWLLRVVVPHRARFGALLALGRLARPLLPTPLRKLVPAAQAERAWPAPRHTRRMLVLDGCVQASAAPNINAAAARVLDRLGVSLVRARGDGCCGALSHHLSAEEEARRTMRRNIDAWWPAIESGVEAIVSTASGCGVHIKDYGRLLQDDAAYADKAARVAALARDIVEVVDATKLPRASDAGNRVVVHSPCTLQHGQRLGGKVESLLRAAGFTLTPAPDGHLCCGSAGSYSLLQPRLSKALRARKLAALRSGEPSAIATANIGCQMHLQAGTDLPVRHWIELVDDALPGARA